MTPRSRRQQVENHRQKIQRIAFLHGHGIDTEPIILPNVVHPDDKDNQDGNRKNRQDVGEAQSERAPRASATDVISLKTVI
jgi:hypothetical protein